MKEQNEEAADLSKPLQFDMTEPKKEHKETPSNSVKYSELTYLGINVISIITNGINHFHFKYMKMLLRDRYEEYSFTIWRYIFVMIINFTKMHLMKETLVHINQLKNNIWFWIRIIDQFIALQTVLIVMKYFRVSTTTCFISMAPVAIVIMSSFLLGERFYMRYIYGILICFGGVMLIVLNEDKSGKPGVTEPRLSLIEMVLGVFWGCVHLLSIAIHRVSSKVLIKENFHINTQIIYPSITCIVLSIVFIVLQRVTFLYSFGLIIHSGVNCCIWLTSTYLMLISYQGLDLIKTTAIGYLNIITVFILGVMFLGETIFVTDVFGSLCILGFNIFNTIYPPHD